MSDGAPTKAELLEALRSSGEQALRTLRALPAAKWTEGRYENGWNAREILAHLSSIEWAGSGRDRRLPHPNGWRPFVRLRTGSEVAEVSIRPILQWLWLGLDGATRSRSLPQD